MALSTPACRKRLEIRFNRSWRDLMQFCGRVSLSEPSQSPADIVQGLRIQILGFPVPNERFGRIVRRNRLNTLPCPAPMIEDFAQPAQAPELGPGYIYPMSFFT